MVSSRPPGAAVILFVDVTCTRPYDDETLRSGAAIGGSEATVVRVAERLAASRPVAVLQHLRETAHTSTEGVLYLPGQYGHFPEVVEHVVLVRNAAFLPFLRRTYPKAKLWLWLHDHPGARIPACKAMILDSGATVITVSAYHQRCVREALGSEGEIVTIFNPADDSLRPDGRPYDPYKLVFLSARERGLPWILKLFDRLRREGPFELHIGSSVQPGESMVDRPGVVDHGAMPYPEAIEHLRGALCMFYPNFEHPETFGLVVTDADAVGTPALVHRFGAFPEVTCHPDEVMDCRDGDAVVARVLAWADGARPEVSLKPEFRASAVIERWKAILG
jgi:glycosyltransferase involved in cell wall biosynthesis